MLATESYQILEATHNQAQQLTEHRDRLGDDECNGPCAQAYRDPRTGSKQTPLMHVMRALASKDSHVDILACDVAENHTGNNHLLEVRAGLMIQRVGSSVPSEWPVRMRPSSSAGRPTRGPEMPRRDPQNSRLPSLSRRTSWYRPPGA